MKNPLKKFFSTMFEKENGQKPGMKLHRLF